MTALIDRFVAFTARHETLLMIVGGLWFFVSCAANAGFIDLPEIPLVTGTLGLALSTGANALWWSWLRPKIEQRKKALTFEGSTDG